jgi:integrase/recombinase XerD
MPMNLHAPAFSEDANLRALPVRQSDYWNILEYCRHIGISNRNGLDRYWLARVRLRAGNYCQIRLGRVKLFHGEGLDYSEAVACARTWFATPEIGRIASEPYEVGTNTELRYEKNTDGFTVGDAMHDYVKWKRVAAARSHFETNLSLINHHIIPRIGDVRLENFHGRLFTDFCLDVLQSPPKRGRQPQGPRVPLERLDHDVLRRRKKTLNTLIGILRLAFRMAWENGEIESERSWRCLRRIPHADTPRHHFLTRRQCQQLLAACRPDLGCLVLGALYTGCRVSELAKLKVADVGGHVFGVFVAPQKSWRSRHVHLTDEGMSFFLDHCENKRDDDLVFTRESGGSWQYGAHKHLFKETVRRASLPSEFVFHGLRHTYASQLVQAGTPLAIVAKQLGHANTDTVSRTYGHLSCQSIEEELSRRFAPLAKRRNDPRLLGIRNSLQSQDAPEIINWPRSNFYKSGGELVSLIRQLNGIEN